MLHHCLKDNSLRDILDQLIPNIDTFSTLMSRMLLMWVYWSSSFIMRLLWSLHYGVKQWDNSIEDFAHGYSHKFPRKWITGWKVWLLCALNSNQCYLPNEWTTITDWLQQLHLNLLWCAWRPTHATPELWCYTQNTNLFVPANNQQSNSILLIVNMKVLKVLLLINFLSSNTFVNVVHFKVLPIKYKEDCVTSYYKMSIK